MKWRSITFSHTTSHIRYAWVVPQRNLKALRDLLWRSLSLEDPELLEKEKSNNLSPELNVYRMAKKQGMRIYDTQPTLVYHARGASNTWKQRERPEIGRWTKEWPTVNSTGQPWPAECAGWGCSCQGFSDTFGTSPGNWKLAGVVRGEQVSTKRAARAWWVAHDCDTSPSGRKWWPCSGVFTSKPSKPSIVEGSDDASLNSTVTERDSVATVDVTQGNSAPDLSEFKVPASPVQVFPTVWVAIP